MAGIIICEQNFGKPNPKKIIIKKLIDQNIQKKIYA
jgi:hypothetical protein